MEKWMREAIKEARLAWDEGEIPVGAVLLHDGKEVCRAHNRREQLHDPTAHAEILCLREGARRLGDWRLRECTLVVTLEPCPMCAGAMIMSQLGQCVFSAADEKQGCCGSIYDLPGDAALHGTTRWQSGILAEECAQLLTSFFARRRNPS